MEIDFLQIAAAVLVLASLSLTFLICLNKWGAITMYELYRYKWMPPSVCVFCVGFWFAMAVQLAVWLIFGIQEIFFVCPFASASLTRLWYESFGFERR